MPSRGTPRRSIRIEDDLWESAQEEAARNGENLSEIIRDVLRTYIEESKGFNQMISDEAVDAAARALREHNPFLPDLAAMGDTPEDEFVCCARAALEAAAPHLLVVDVRKGFFSDWLPRRQS